MIQLYSLMWVLAVFFAIIGYQRGWNRELIATSGIILGFFALFQFDSVIRGTLLLSFPPEQAFFIQAAIFIAIVFFSYQNRVFIAEPRPGRLNFQAGLLGALVGFINGYLIGGTLWYFMDINQYPFDPYILAPSPTSPSAQQLGSMPLVILGGGVGGSGDLLAVAVILMFLMVLIVL
ncbi:MAG: CvpA family protein [bacterium]|nr:CvpA family protein [bacterium]